jgi:histone-lysine N-methyltransferase SETMAR
MSSFSFKIEKNEYRAIIKYLFIKGKTAKEIFEDMSETLNEECPSNSTIKYWVSNFKRGDFSTKDGERSGRPISATTQENIDAIHDMILEDRRISSKKIAEILSLSTERVSFVIRDVLDMRKLSAKWVPKCLNSDQKRERVETSKAILSRINDQPDFFSRIVTMDETWLHHYDPETKEQSKEWRHSGSPRPKKFRSQKSAGKVMASIFWDTEGIIMIDYLEKGKTVNSVYYMSLLSQLKEKLKEKRRGKLTRGVLFLQDNAPAHKSHVTMQKLGEIGFELLPHPPYSPDLAPSDYYLFPQLKKFLKGTKFDSNTEVEQTAEAWFRGQTSEFYLDGLKKLEHRCNKCIVMKGDYVE